MDEHISELMKKNVFQMNYDELTELANWYLEEGCENKDWTTLKCGLRCLQLAMNIVEAKADATKKVLKECL